MTRAAKERLLLDGAAGEIECIIDLPAGGESRDRFHDVPRDKFNDAPRGVALVAHPHPLFGGNLDNKVAQTLAKTFVELGYVALRPNFRGVGASAGEHDQGRGETEDLLAVIDYARARFHAGAPVLAGSWGRRWRRSIALPLRRAVGGRFGGGASAFGSCGGGDLAHLLIAEQRGEVVEGARVGDAGEDHLGAVVGDDRRRLGAPVDGVDLGHVLEDVDQLDPQAGAG